MRWSSLATGGIAAADRHAAAAALASAAASRSASHSSIDRLVLASNNPGKLREFTRLLAPLGIDVDRAGRARHSRGGGAASDVRRERARQGASRVAAVRTARARRRFGHLRRRARRRAGRASRRAMRASRRSDARNNAKLIADLQASTTGARITSACWCWCATPTIRSRSIAEGRWHGDRDRRRRADSGGFGYDPYFLDPRYGLTGAEFALEQKNAVSHRGSAMRVC